MESPIAAIRAGPDDTLGTDDDYTNLVNQYLGTYAYSYTFDGQAGYLDHALSSASLTTQVTGVAEWHINSDEADVLDYDTTFKPDSVDALYEAAAYRSSDHDGVIVGLDLTASQTPGAITINAGDNQSATVTTSFGTQLDLTVTDANGNPVADAEVTFAGPLTGASASISGTGPFLTDDSGRLVVTATANAVAGGPYELVATAGSATASFHLTNQAGAPATVTINAGDDQATPISTAFPTQLDLTVTDSAGNPVPGVTVTFAGPVAGASASIATPGPYTTDADGNLVVIAQANATAGAYQLVATAGSATATFNLTNLVGAPATIAVNAGDDQQTIVNTNFPTQLDLTVLDAGGNPVPNATVTFAGPASGASASIVETGPYTTDGNGNLVVTARANAIAGAYQLVATAGAASAGFDLTNLPLPAVKLSAGETCATFSDGTASTLSEVTYSLRKGKISALSVGTFSYWIAVAAVAGTNTLSVDQSITTGNFARLFAVAAASTVYRSSCGGGVKSTFTQTTTAAASGTVTVTFTAPTAGTYFVNVKLATSEMKGEAPPTPGTVHFVFSTTGMAGSARALDLSAQ
jgi:protocatechuate 3,4-dioxygenase beta subunit